MNTNYWLVLQSNLSKEHVLKIYREITGRYPDIIHSPEESGNFWWAGWLAKDEYYSVRYFKKGRG